MFCGFYNTNIMQILFLPESGVLLGGAVVTSKLEGFGFERAMRMRPLCVEFARPPRVCMGSLHLPPTVQDMQVNW